MGGLSFVSDSAFFSTESERLGSAGEVDRDVVGADWGGRPCFGGGGLGDGDLAM